MNKEIKEDYDLKRLADFIGLQNKDISRYLNELNVIKGWGEKKTKSKDMTDIFRAVKELKQQLGYQEIGQESAKRLYRSIRLDLGINRIQNNN